MQREGATSDSPTHPHPEQSTGEPLQADVRSRFEPMFGTDLGDVRVHTDATAAQSARGVDAVAYTVGNDIYFGAGRFDPGTPDGRRLLGHELAHTVQQRGAGAMAAEAPSAEREAARAAAAVDAPAGTRVAVSAHRRGIARQKASETGSADAQLNAQTSPQTNAPVNAPAKAPADVPADAPHVALVGSVNRAAAAVELLRRIAERYKSDRRLKDGDAEKLTTIRQYVELTNHDPRATKLYAHLSPSEQAFAKRYTADAEYHLQQLEKGIRTGSPRLDDERTWTAPLGALRNAARYLHVINHYRDPVKLRPGWHVVVDDAGNVHGYIRLASATWELWNTQGKMVTNGAAEPPLERPFIDPIDIFAGLITVGAALAIRIALRPIVRSLVRSAGRRVAQATLATHLGLSQTTPILVDQVAPKVFILSETLAADSAPLKVAVEAVETSAGSVARSEATTATGATATQSASGASASAGSQSAATVAGPTAMSNIPGAQHVQVSEAEYQSRQGFVTMSQYDNPVLRSIEEAGQRAAAALANPQNPASARFIQACRSRNWALAGTLFHSAAAAEIRAAAPALLREGIQISAEDTVQSGRGGSRFDTLSIDASGAHYEVDWKTTGKSALSTKSREEMTRHSSQYQANRNATLDVQISKSWVDFVRGLITGVEWP